MYFNFLFVFSRCQTCENLYLFQHVDEELVSQVLVNSEMAEDVKKVAVLLVLCGWSQGQGSYLRSDSDMFSFCNP